MKNGKQESKVRLFTCIFVFVLGTIFSLFVTGALIELLEMKTLEHYKLIPSMRHIVTKEGAIIFLSLLGITGMFTFMLGFIGTKPYKSDLVKITDDIYIPVKAGQNQFGSAEFYKDIDKHFNYIIIENKDVADQVRRGMAFKKNIQLFHDKIVAVTKKIK